MPLVDGPIYGTPLTLALVEPKLRGARPRRHAHARAGAAARPRDGRAVRRSSSSASRTACRTAWRWPSTRRSASSSTPATSRSIRRRSTASTSTCTASRSSARRACWRCFADSTNIDRRGFTGSETEVVEAFEEIFTSATGRLIVAAFASSIYRMQILVDLAAQFDRKVAFVGRGMIQNSEIAQRLGYLRIPAGVQIRDSDVGDLSRAGRPLPGDRLAGRADVGAVAHRDRRSPPRQARPGRHRRALGARDSRQREGDRPGHQSPRAARRRRHPRRHQARPRLGTRQRGRAEADAVARPAALLRPGARRVPPALAARAHRRARLRRARAEARDPARRERRRPAVRRRRRAGSPARRRSGAS